MAEKAKVIDIKTRKPFDPSAKHNIESLLDEAKARELAIGDYTTEYANIHNAAYQSALEQIGGNPSALEDEKTHSKFIKALKDFYIKAYIDKHGKKFKDGTYGQLQEREALRYMSGITEDILERIVKDNKGKYTAELHGKLRDEHIKQLKKTHEPFIVEHITEKHKDIVADAYGFDKKKRDMLDLDKIRTMFSEYRGIESQKKKSGEQYQFGLKDAA